MTIRAATALVAAVLALGAASAAAADVAYNPTLRVMLHPDAAARFTVPAAAQARLEELAGTPLTWTASTRTGAAEFAVAGPRSPAELEAIARRLRSDRSVLWVQQASQGVPASLVQRPAHEAQAPARRMLVRLHDGVEPDWSSLLPRWSAATGTALSVERAIGEVFVVALPAAVPTEQLEALAETLQQDGAVRFADPVRRMRPAALPADAFYPGAWWLSDPTAGIGLPAAWDVSTGNASVTVAVVDTGTLPHPDLAGRVLPGYDFISDPGRARDGDARDSNPRDEGDWLSEGDCGGFPAQPSFWHGLFVEGIVAANANAGVGLSGVDRAAKVLPVRALGRCGGTVEDVYEAMLWAAGAAVPGVPANPNPAKVINMSLGGWGSCGGALQEAVDEALAQGTVVVVSAGNESDVAQNFAPANCSGVIVVGATNRRGDRTGYSNFGRRVDLSAPGGEGGRDGLILSTFNSGRDTPAEPGYAYAAGTSFSAPLVSGTVSLMLARNPNLSTGQVLSILQGTSREFPAGSACAVGGFCGAGLLDAGAAVASTRPAVSALPPGAVAIVELYDPWLDHFTVSADAFETSWLEGSGRWLRTGHVFYGYEDPSLAPAPVRPVCRFYGSAAFQLDSYFFTADDGECGYLAASGAPRWSLETTSAFWIEVPGFDGRCRAGTLPVYRFFNNRQDASQRFTVDLSVKRAMVNRAWVPDGPGERGAAFCSAM